MNKNVFAALAGDKAKALRVVKPLHCSLFHDIACSFDLNLRELSSVVQGAEQEQVSACAELAEPFESERRHSIPRAAPAGKQISERNESKSLPQRTLGTQRGVNVSRMVSYRKAWKPG